MSYTCAATVSYDLCSHVLLSIPFVAPSDDFPRAKLVARSHVGQVGNLRRIVNPPAGSTHNSGHTPSLFAARRYAGQVVNLRPIVNRPAGSTHNAGDRRHHLPIGNRPSGVSRDPGSGGCQPPRRMPSCPTFAKQLQLQM